MENIAALFAWIQASVGTFAGFGVDDSHSVASFLMVIALALFGAVCVNQYSERRDNVHLTINLLAMFAGGIAGNAALRGLQLTLGIELVLTVTLALFGMSAAALVLLLTYSRTQF
jgi:hypothetical protein